MVAASGDYSILPGGLTRCSPEKGSLIVTNQEGGISKDTWIEVPMILKGAPVINRLDMNHKALLPSRAAENLFWVGRYTQRIVKTSRFIRTALRNFGQTGYLIKGQETEALRALLATVTHLTFTYPGFADSKKELSADNILNEIHSLICKPDKVGSIVFTVNSLLRATYAVRDKWAVDNWRIIDDIENVKRRLENLEQENIRHVFSLLDQLNLGLLAFLESNRQSMYRGDGWMMYRIGQYMEDISLELTQYKSLLTVAYNETTEFQVLEALLVTNQSLSNYRSAYRTYFDVAPALDLLFVNTQNPISVLKQLEQLVRLLDQLPQNDSTTHHNELSNLAFDCYSKVRLIDINNLMKVDVETGVRTELEVLCQTLYEKISNLSMKLSSTYFSHSEYHSQDKGFQFEV